MNTIADSETFGSPRIVGTVWAGASSISSDFRLNILILITQLTDLFPLPQHAQQYVGRMSISGGTPISYVELLK